jgi:AAA domain
LLEHGRTDMEIDRAALPNDSDKSLIWIQTDSLGDQGFQKPEVTGTSFTNPSEANVIAALLKRWDDCEPFRRWLDVQTKHAHPIGIICTYAGQRDLLRKKLQVTNLSERLRSSIKIDTVDSYQGKENPIIVLSLVRNNSDGPQERGAATIKDGFLSRSNRINVAISRAMDRLVIVGSKGRWRSSSPMTRIVQAFDEEVDRGEARVILASSLQDDRPPVRQKQRHVQPLPTGTEV